MFPGVFKQSSPSVKIFNLANRWIFIVENKPRIHNLAFTQFSPGNMNDTKEQKCNRTRDFNAISQFKKSN